MSEENNHYQKYLYAQQPKRGRGGRGGGRVRGRPRGGRGPQGIASSSQPLSSLSLNEVRASGRGRQNSQPNQVRNAAQNLSQSLQACFTFPKAKSSNLVDQKKKICEQLKIRRDATLDLLKG